tara:strand:+ start:1139 stop:1405 length:267 start_codon:yes stop_codon:yes gene_type:complete
MNYECICCDKLIEKVKDDKGEELKNPKNGLMLLSYAGYGSKYNHGASRYTANHRVNMFFICDECYKNNITKGINFQSVTSVKMAKANL